nr:hypothetical protein CFP56_09035 [Quercus suber]
MIRRSGLACRQMPTCDPEAQLQENGRRESHAIQGKPIAAEQPASPSGRENPPRGVVPTVGVARYVRYVRYRSASSSFPWLPYLSVCLHVNISLCPPEQSPYSDKGLAVPRYAWRKATLRFAPWRSVSTVAGSGIGSLASDHQIFSPAG